MGHVPVAVENLKISAVRQWQLLGGQHDLVGLDRAIRANRLLLGSHLFGIEAAGPSRFP
jgi:hypothetical protein